MILNEKAGLPVFNAKPETPYRSRTLLFAMGVAHKVIHRNCVKAGRPPREAACRKFHHLPTSCFESIAYRSAPAIAHKLVHRRCAEKQGNARAGACLSTAIILISPVFSFEIKVLSECAAACTQSCPQKVCRSCGLVHIPGKSGEIAQKTVGSRRKPAAARAKSSAACYLTRH